MHAIAPRSPSSPGILLPWGLGRRAGGAGFGLAVALLALALPPL